MGFRAEAALAEVSEEHEKSAMMTAARATTVFTAAEIRVACDGFSPKKLIGRGVSSAVAGRDAESGTYMSHLDFVFGCHVSRDVSRAA